MIIWPRQLVVINRLAATKGMREIQLIAMPSSVEITVTYDDGSYDRKLINIDGKEIQRNEIFGNE